MQDYGNFLPSALISSNDLTLNTLGRNLILFPFLESEDTYYTVGFRLVMEESHALVETASYLQNLVNSYEKKEFVYIIKEKVSSNLQSPIPQSL